MDRHHGNNPDQKINDQTTNKNYIIGTRGSKLSLAQTVQTIKKLKKANPVCNYTIMPITTKGDVDTRPLFTIDQKGIFEKEIDMAVSQKKVDFAVHSMKDVPSTLPDGLVLGCVPPRESADDVLVTRKGYTIHSLPAGAVVGTSSLRRAVQTNRIRPDVIVKPIRGNVETRIKKVVDCKVDGIILAYAGLARLDLLSSSSDVTFEKLPSDLFVSSPGQGALAIVARGDDYTTIQMLQKIEDMPTRIEIEAERALSMVIDSGCRFPVGAHARITKDMVHITADAFSMDGSERIRVILQDSIYDQSHTDIGRRAGEELLKKGARDLAINWRKGVQEWNNK